MATTRRISFLYPTTRFSNKDVVIIPMAIAIGGSGVSPIGILLKGLGV
jgi:hypothetical protein